MDFELSPEQESLRKIVQSMLADNYGGIDQRNKVADTESGYSEQVWTSLAELGVLGLPFAEEHGGMGAGPVEVGAVAGELGRVLAPEPFLDAVLLPGFLVETAGSAEQCERLLPALGEGTLKLAFAHDEPGSRWPHIQVDTQARAAGEGYALTGTKSPVAAGDAADQYVVSAQLDGGRLGLFLVDAAAPGLVRNSYRTHDERRGAELILEGVQAELLGGTADAAETIRQAYIYAQTIQSAEAVGALREALHITVEYLKQRKQFGTTLSTFQALTHRSADMYVAIEMAASLSLRAVAALADGVFDQTLASQAKLHVGRAATFIGEQCVQMHGGIGITYEYPISHYLSRLTAISQTYGSTDAHLRELAARVTVD